MVVADFEPLSLNDYPGKVASLVFIHGCNLLCRFCYNRELVLPHYKGTDRTEEFFKFIKENKINNVAITGGEPLFHPKIIEFLERLKLNGVNVKIDTNGFSYKKLKLVLENDLIDYVAIDVKGFDDEEIKYITRTNYSFTHFAMTYEIVKLFSIPFELRITVWKNFDEEKVKSFFNLIEEDDTVILQKPVLDKPLLDKRFNEKLASINFEENVEKFAKYFPRISVRNQL